MTERPNGDQLDAFEKAMANALEDALEAWRAELLRGLTADAVADIFARLNDAALRQPLRDVMADWLRRVAGFGVSVARDDIERRVMGVKSLADLVAGIAWDLANDAAAEWALWYADNLIGQIAKTTSPRIQRLVADWISNSESFDILVDRVRDDWLFSRERAETIAITEVTRAYAEGNTAAWRASGVVQQRQWMTARDERVCPICAPLNGRIADIDKPFDGPVGPVKNPPGHPKCRCLVGPVIIEQPLTRAREREIEATLERAR